MTTRQTLSFGETLYFHGMVVCLAADNKLRVEWANLPDNPVCYLNAGDGAYNYVQHKMIHFDCTSEDGQEVYLEIEGGSYDDITRCTVWKRREGMHCCFNDENDHKAVPHKLRGIREYLYTLANINYCQFIDNGK